MPTVAELQVDINAKDDASATIMALDALIKELDSGDVDIDINANTGDAQARLQELLARLRELDRSDPDIDIDVNTGGATAELARLRAELDAMRDETIRVRVNSDEVRRATGNMGDFRTSAMNASRSMRPLTAAVLALGTALIPLGAVAVGGIMALATAFAAAGIGAGLFAAVAITAFGPVKEALKQLASAQEEYNKATTDKERDAALAKTKAIMDGLSPSVRTMVQSVLDFKTAWRAFADQFQPEIFQIAQEGLAGLAGLLPSLAPMVQGAADAFLSLERSVIASLGSPWWQSWMGEIGSVMQPLLEGLGRSIGNIITAFAGLMLAFMPLTLDFVGGMERMTGAFANWAQGLEDSKGFQNFIAYVRENTPLVLGLIASLAGAFVALVKAGAPLGEALVIMATNLFNAMIAFQQAHPQAATFGLALLAVLAVAIKLTGPLLSIGSLVMTIASALLSLASPLMAIAGFFVASSTAAALLVIAFIAIVAALIYAYTHFEAFRNLVNTVAGAIADFAVMVYDAIVAGLGAAASWLSSTFGPAVQAVVDFVVEQFNKIKDWATENSATFQAAWTTIVEFIKFVMVLIGAVIGAGLVAISAVWNAVWPTLSEIIRGVWEAIKGIISGALDIILGMILFWAGVLAGDWSAMGDGIVQIARGMWEAVAGVFTGAFIILQAIATAAGNILMAILGAIWAGIWSAATTAWSLIVTAVSAAWTAITAVVSAAVPIIQNIINAFWNAVFAIFQAAWNLIVAGMSAFWATLTGLVSAAWNGIVALFQAAWAGIVAGMSAFWATLTGLVSAAWNAITALFTGAMNGIQNAVNAFWAAVIAVFQAAWALLVAGLSSFWATLTSLTSAAMNAIQALITAAWNAITNAIQAALAAIQAAVAAAWNAITSLITTAMSAILNAIVAGWNTITNAIQSAMTTILNTIQSGWNAIVRAVQNAIQNVVSAIQNGMSNATQAVQSGIAAMVGIVTGAAGAFFSAGASLISNLISGVQSMLGGLTSVIGTVVGILTGPLPGSPAEYGPLSGQGWTKIRGQHYVQDIASGITGESGLVASAARDIADLMTLDLNSGAAFSAIANGTSTGGGDGGGITISVAPGAIVLSIGDGVTAGDARQAFDGAASSLADELLTAIRRR